MERGSTFFFFLMTNWIFEKGSGNLLCVRLDVRNGRVVLDEGRDGIVVLKSGWGV